MLFALIQTIYTQELGGHDFKFQQLKLIDSVMYTGLGKMFLLICKFQVEHLKEGEMYLTSDRTGSHSTYTTALDVLL